MLGGPKIHTLSKLSYLIYRVFQKKCNIAIFSLNLFQRSDYAGGRDSCRVSGNKISDDLVHKTPSADLLIILDGHESPLF